MQEEFSKIRKPAELPTAIAGVVTIALTPLTDMRGAMCEIHRDGWIVGAPRPAQWDFVTTHPNVLRGVHVHQLRFDYIVVLNGHASIGLADVRRDMLTFRQCVTIEATGDAPIIVLIPPGVAHGIYAHGPLSYLYGLTTVWDGSDEDLGCRYDDPLLGIRWPVDHPILLQRDAALPDFQTMVCDFEDAGGVRVDAAGISRCRP